MKDKFNRKKHIQKHKARIVEIRKKIRERTMNKHIKEKRETRISEEK